MPLSLHQLLLGRIPHPAAPCGISIVVFAINITGLPGLLRRSFGLLADDGNKIANRNLANSIMCLPLPQFLQNMRKYALNRLWRDLKSRKSLII